MQADDQGWLFAGSGARDVHIGLGLRVLDAWFHGEIILQHAGLGVTLSANSEGSSAWALAVESEVTGWPTGRDQDKLMLKRR